MYSLTLTGEERDAFDWVGNRYSTGDDVADILKSCIPEREDDEWAGRRDFRGSRAQGLGDSGIGGIRGWILALLLR